MSLPGLVYYDILKYHPRAMEFMRRHFSVTELPSPEADTGQALARAQVLLAPLGHRVDAAKMDRCPGLRVIASNTLSIPHIDADEAARRGVAVVSLAGEREFMFRVTPTVDLAFALMIALVRHLPWAMRDPLEGRWGGRPWGRKTPRMLSRMRLGVVGLGRLGSLTAERAEAMGMGVSYYSPNSRDERFERCESLEELAASADVVSLHAHHTPETAGFIDKNFFAAMRQGSYLVNTARGELVDEAALLEALRSGPLAGAALDVLSGEHDPGFRERLNEHPLVRHAREHQNLILTPHYAGATQDAWWLTQTRTLELAHQAWQEVTAC